MAKFGKLDTWGGAQAALFDTATAQAIVGEPGKFDWISAAGDDGISQATLTAASPQVLPPGNEAITGAEFTEESQDAFQKLIAIFNTFLLTFALIALFVGSFIIYNTFSIIVAQRTRELALLRARRGQPGARSLRLGAARGVRRRPRRLGHRRRRAASGWPWASTPCSATSASPGPRRRSIVPPSAVISSLAVGTGITVVAAIFPARKAATIAPVAAMRDLGHRERPPPRGAARSSAS